MSKRNPYAALIARGYTRSQLAEIFGVSLGAISHYIHGRKKVSAMRAVAIEIKTKGEITRRELRPDLFT